MTKILLRLTSNTPSSIYLNKDVLYSFYNVSREYRIPTAWHVHATDMVGEVEAPG